MLGRLRTASLVTALVAFALASASSGQSPGPPGNVPSVPPGGTTPGGPSGGAPPDLDAAIAVKQRHADALLDLPGVVGVGVGLDPAGKPVIRVYKEKADAAVVPSSLEGVAVESAVTGIIEARAPTDRFPRPVPIGVSSGLDGVATGTLGARVTNGTNVYMLSNNHVFAGINTAAIGDPIIQPGNVDGGSDPADRIGTLAAYQTIDFNGGNNTMDAAIALTTTGNVGTATPADGYGAPSSVTTQASIGLAVQKYGRTTGLQLGTVAATNVSVDVCYLLLFNFCLQEARFVGQISVSPGAFSGPGDSGSLIVTQGGNQPVALLFAGGDGLTIGTPIDLVLQRFGVTIEGQPPGDGPPGAPTGLSAQAGDGSVSLSWSAPSFDGNSPITGYRVYRSTSPGGETLLQSVGPGTTSFLDDTVTNGATYYYKVSAENALGEGPLSSEASATPAGASPPAEPLPTLDDFNRANENPLSGGWTNAINGGVENGLNVSSNQLACTATTTCTAWRSNPQYGPDVEVYARVAALPGTNNHIRLYARLKQQGSASYDAYLLRTNQLDATDEIYLERIDNGAHVRLATVSRELAVGDTLLLRVDGSTIEGWLHDGASWTRLATVGDLTYPAAGYVGIGLRGTIGRLDDFGARTTSLSVPGAPTALTAAAGNTSVQLSWTAPSYDGGSQITGYRIYRGIISGGEGFIQSVGPGTTSFLDGNLTNGTTYYYKVSAENAVGEGPLSNGASATPDDLTPPVEPLPVLDDFNRTNENPLFGAGSWGNGANGSAEKCLKVVSNQLASDKSTTCTAVRTAQLAPDVEVYTRIAVLPGTSNHIRLKARIQQPGTSGYDGYMLRTNQISGPDEVYLERIDNGVFFRLATGNRDLAAGDALLFRITGPRLEAWLLHAGQWSRVAAATDSTYAGSGYVGLGLRGTTGRLDDFGARTTGLSVPSAPSSLAAAAGNGSVTLSWTAPSFDGGSQITGYRIYRGTSSGGESYLQSIGPGTSFPDTTVVNGTTYYYKVSAENAIGEGPLSNEASATPDDLTPPVEPLSVLDDFNRANENPLFGGGSWGNGANGSGEKCMKVVSNQLASNKSTTCTAVRSAQSPANVEVYARITVLPGTSNHIRLKARIQQPGTSGYDGYMLRTNQLSGADEVYLERIDNGVFVRLATVNRDLAAGDTLLLRVKGSKLEAWLLHAGAWSRMATATDSTYAGAGYTGIGLRGTTGRLDDFGARALP